MVIPFYGNLWETALESATAALNLPDPAALLMPCRSVHERSIDGLSFSPGLLIRKPGKDKVPDRPLFHKRVGGICWSTPDVQSFAD
ncbi:MULTISPECIES: hypothetical protein [Akkermansia]|jgi:hypothetical protein|uniref:hypothetical protein n=1 Tax=Akkermansia sp. TaxID=1872421 RepID=UPI001C061D2E|nr:hypothetical protein [Candidatus Akkermansia timonensis]QWO94509.1 hypothetical protein J5W56_05895 [Candidatus Akkermansia timonensis]